MVWVIRCTALKSCKCVGHAVARTQFPPAVTMEHLFAGVDYSSLPLFNFSHFIIFFYWVLFFTDLRYFSHSSSTGNDFFTFLSYRLRFYLYAT